MIKDVLLSLSVAASEDVLLSLSVAASEDFTVDYAVSLAKTFGARVTGIAFAYEKVPTGILGDETWVDSVEQLRNAARAAIARFEKSDADVANEAQWLSATFLGTADEFGRMVRRFDLSVVRQAEPRTGTSDHLIAQAALFDSGRPVIVVPYGHTMPSMNACRSANGSTRPTSRDGSTSTAATGASRGTNGTR